MCCEHLTQKQEDTAARQGQRDARPQEHPSRKIHVRLPVLLDRRCNLPCAHRVNPAGRDNRGSRHKALHQADEAYTGRPKKDGCRLDPDHPKQDMGDRGHAHDGRGAQDRSDGCRFVHLAFCSILPC